MNSKKRGRKCIFVALCLNSSSLPSLKYHFSPYNPSIGAPADSDVCPPPPPPQRSCKVSFLFLDCVRGFFVFVASANTRCPLSLIGSKGQSSECKGATPYCHGNVTSGGTKGSIESHPMKQYREECAWDSGGGGGIFHNRSKKFAHPC